MFKKYLVKKSGIHGTGVFAARDIKKGEKIIEYVGNKITKKESDKISEKTVKKANKDRSLGKVYIFELNEKYDLDGNVSFNPAKYINHSCDPNAETEQDEKDRIWIMGMKYIKKGEEITYNYGYDLADLEDHQCECGSKNCVGYILAEKHWKKIK